MAPSIEMEIPPAPLKLDEDLTSPHVDNGSSDYLPLSPVHAELDEPVSGAKKLRKMIEQTNELVVCPGVYDGLSARTAIELGFNAMYMVC
jgi:hypothetical protein